MATPDNSILFKRMNAIRKETGLSMKEAYARAKAELTEPEVTGNPALGKKVLEKMANNNVRFSYKNQKGKVIVTVGTTRFERVPKARIVQGSRKCKAGNTLFYDVRHGVYRQFNPDTVIEIQSISPR